MPRRHRVVHGAITSVRHSNRSARHVFGESAKRVATPQPCEVVERLGKRRRVLDIDVSPVSMFPEEAGHDGLWIVHAVGVALRSNAHRMCIGRQYGRKESMIEEQPRFKLSLDANEVHGAVYETRLSQTRENVLPIVAPAEGFALVGPCGALVPKDDHSLAARSEKQCSRRAAVVDQPRLIVHGDNVDFKFEAGAVAQQRADSTANDVFQPLGTALDQDADFHGRPCVKRPIVYSRPAEKDFDQSANSALLGR